MDVAAATGADDDLIGRVFLSGDGAATNGADAPSLLSPSLEDDVGPRI